MGVIRQFSNTSQVTALDTSITASQTSIVVPAWGGYPSPPLSVKVDSEILLVTAVTALLSGKYQLTVQRGYDGTLAVAHDAATELTHVAIAEDFRNRWQDTIVQRPFAIYDDEFDDDTLDPSWTTVAPTGTAVWTERNGMLSGKFDNQTSQDCAAIVKNALGLTPLIYVQTATRMLSRSGYNLLFGPVLTDGFTTTSSMVWLAPQITGSTFTISLRYGTMTSVDQTAWTVTLSTAGPLPWLHLRLYWASLNTFRAEWSPDGISWTRFDPTVAFNLVTTFTPTYVGIGGSTWGSNEEAIGTVEYFRVTS